MDQVSDLILSTLVPGNSVSVFFRTVIMKNILSVIAAITLSLLLLAPVAIVQASDKESTGKENPTVALDTQKEVKVRRNLFGDWLGLRSFLEDRGIRVSLYYTHYWGSKARGGRQASGSQRHSGSGDLFILANLEKMGLIPGAEIFMQVKNNYGKNINTKVAALSDPFDDADFNEPFYIDQLWYQQSLFDQIFRFRLGYIDLQTFLDRNAYANSEDKQFMSTLLDNNNATIPLKIGLGATLFVDPVDWLELVLGTVDADSKLLHTGFGTAFDDFESLMVYFEAGLKTQGTAFFGSLPGKYRMGVFYDPRNKKIFGRKAPVTGLPVTNGGDLGFYLSLDQMVYREGKEGSQGLGVFLRYGYRDPDMNRIAHFWSTGFQYQGLLPSRNEDACGFAVYSAIGSNRYRDAVNPDFSGETGFELYYRIQWKKYFALTPDVQWIHNPGGLESREDALVVGVRGRIAF